MNKADIVKDIAEKTNVSQVTAERMLYSVLNGIMEGVACGNKVHIAGFGTFEQKKRAGHICKNPRTGEEMQVGSYRMPVFRPSAAFKRKVTGGIDNEL